MSVDEQTRHFEDLLRDGITAARNQQRALAQSLLRRAIMLNRYDARPYLWLTATTDDPQEQRDYLEQAVARDPANVAARQALARLIGKLEPKQPAGEPKAYPAFAAQAEPAEVRETQAQVFQCPNCGGQMHYDSQAGSLVCTFCHYSENGPAATPQTAGAAEQVLEFVMPTAQGHSWAEDMHRLACSQCGAISLLAPGDVSHQCAYCGSNQMISSKESRELLDPNVVAVMKIAQEQARLQIQKWLGRGLFAPDDLAQALPNLQLRPAYYSAWTFDGEVELRWNCEVNVGTSRAPRWEARNGLEARFFDDVLVSGVRALKDNELEQVGPFNLKQVIPFAPEVLAGWPALIYDRSLSDASLIGREKVTKKLRQQLWSLVEPGREKRNLNTSGGTWNAMTFKHILLPLWVGAYTYRGKAFSLLVNGQTGKVGGRRPVDQIKVLLAVLSALLILGLLILTIWHYRDNLIQIWRDIIGQ